ncbi:MAG: efflux RND transporter permease subunit, partial [Phycisphaerae bacterium]
IEQIPLYTPTGRIIPLAAVVDRIDTTALQQINHIEQQRSVTLTVRAPEGVALDTLQQAVQEIVTQLRRQGAIDPSITITYAGNASRLAQTRNALIGQWRGLTVQSLTSFCSSRFFIALLVIFLLMAALFESFLYPFVILFSVPLAAVGGFIGLHLSYWYSLANPVQPIQLFDVLTALGFIILIGVVVNNAILIVHQALNNMRYAAMPPRQAISESVRTRIRPIFMTSLTSVFAMGPLCLRTGPGSELYRGLGSVMVGGLLVATIFTLFLVPALFSLTMAARDKLISAVGRLVRPAAALPATPGGGDGQ